MISTLIVSLVEASMEEVEDKEVIIILEVVLEATSSKKFMTTYLKIQM